MFERANAVKVMGHEHEKSKVLILKVNMQVIVIKSVWGPAPGDIYQCKNKVLKMAVFSGAMILIMLKVKQ